MILKIGIRNKGFTLIEVMVATAVLSLGAVLVYEAFFISLDSFNHYSRYLDVATWLDEKAWQAQDDLGRLGEQARIETSGQFLNRNKLFNWNLSYDLIDELPQGGLYKIDLSLFWQEGRKNAKLYRVAYALYEKKE